MHSFVSAQIIDNGAAVALQRPDGGCSRFHATWLRDNAQDAETRAPDNGQRLIALRDIPPTTTLASARIGDDGIVEFVFEPDGKVASFASAWLQTHAYDRQRVRSRGWLAEHIQLWDADLQANIPCVDFERASTDNATLGRWLSAVRRFGFAKMSGGPIESAAVLKVAELFGHVRETNYGRWFEVRSEINPSNLAYTGLGLQAHTDNPYRDPVPTLQILYCLENSAQGGESMVVDGYAAVQRLREASTEDFDLLSRYCARFEYAGTSAVRLRARKPMIELAADGELIAVRFNNRSTAPIVDVPYEDMTAYYRAYRHFGDIIDAPEMSVRFKLEPGECFIVDNTRVLHARQAYSSTGSRWLQGCYADKDGLLSKLEVIQEHHNDCQSLAEQERL